MIQTTQPERVKLLRVVLLYSGLTMRQVANAVGTSTTKLNYVANGVIEADDALRARLADYFNVAEARLFARLVDELPWLETAP